MKMHCRACNISRSLFHGRFQTKAEALTLNDRNTLIESISTGEKPKEKWRIGSEHEKFTFYKDSFEPVPYEGERGIERLLLAWKACWAGSALKTRARLSGSSTPSKGAPFLLSRVAVRAVRGTTGQPASDLP